MPSPLLTSSVSKFSPVGDLVRYLVLFVIDLQTRRVHIAVTTTRADGAWMVQIARNLTDVTAGPLNGFRYLIVDRRPAIH